jgi:hypothetical protein
MINVVGAVNSLDKTYWLSRNVKILVWLPTDRARRLDYVSERHVKVFG